MDAGHIVEHGSFDELMKAKGTFYQQVNARGEDEYLAKVIRHPSSSAPAARASATALLLLAEVLVAAAVVGATPA